MTTNRFATRLNSFASRPQAEWPDLAGKPSMLQMAERAAKVEGLTDLDLNYPDHVGKGLRKSLESSAISGLTINGFAMRYYTNPAFKLGAFTNPDPAVRREAIDLTKKGIDAAREAGANLMTLWLGQDGFDYAFQADYAKLWQHEIDGIREVAAHDPGLPDQHRVQAERAALLQPDARCGHDACWRSRRSGCPISASRSISPTSSMPTSSRPLRPRSSRATAGCSACISTTATPSATTA